MAILGKMVENAGFDYQVVTFDGKRTVPSAEVSQVMLSLLELKPTDKLLEIGTGSASQTQLWAKYCGEVHSIELEPFVDPAKHRDGDYYLHTGNGKEGLRANAPFDAIVATCGVKDIPKAWEDQLAENGRLVVPLGLPECQKLTLFRKIDGYLKPEKVAAYCRFSMMEAA